MWTQYLSSNVYNTLRALPPELHKEAVMHIMITQRCMSICGIPKQKDNKEEDEDKELDEKETKRRRKSHHKEAGVVDGFESLGGTFTLDKPSWAPKFVTNWFKNRASDPRINRIDFDNGGVSIGVDAKVPFLSRRGGTMRFNNQQVRNLIANQSLSGGQSDAAQSIIRSLTPDQRYQIVRGIYNGDAGKQDLRNLISTGIDNYRSGQQSDVPLGDVVNVVGGPMSALRLAGYAYM